MDASLENDAAGVVLPPVLDLGAAAALLEVFLARRGGLLVVDASAVQRMGAQCLQVLLAARAAWAADEQDFLLKNGSEDFVATMELLGVAPDGLTYRRELA